MIDLLTWAGSTLVASTALMLLVLMIRTPTRRWAGPQLGYMLWAIPVLRMALPSWPIPALIPALTPPTLNGFAPMTVLFAGPRGLYDLNGGAGSSAITALMLTIWLGGAAALFTVLTIRHFRFCHRLRATAVDFGCVTTIRILGADVEGPLAFGVFKRFIAVPRNFFQDYDAGEQALALAHERAHHARGDLLANWVSLVMLAVHWWNPVAWVAIRAFRDDQELAADAQVLAGREASALPLYARVLAKAAGIGMSPACNLHARSNLKGRLMALNITQRSRKQFATGTLVLAFLGGATLAVSATPTNQTVPAQAGQATTIGVKPDGTGGYALLVSGEVVAPSAPLPNGMTLPADFTGAGGCDLKPVAKPFAMVIKETGRTTAYTVMCASAAPQSVQATLYEGLASLKAMRASIETQPATASFPEAERTHAVGVVDGSIREVTALLGKLL